MVCLSLAPVTSLSIGFTFLSFEEFLTIYICLNHDDTYTFTDKLSDLLRLQ